MKSAIHIGAVAIAALALTACASTQVSTRAANLPMFASEQSHPAVMETMGTVHAYACPGGKTDASVIDDAVSSLRQRADAKGATALIDYSYRFVANSPRAQQCSRILEASAVAVVLAGA